MLRRSIFDLKQNLDSLRGLPWSEVIFGRSVALAKLAPFVHPSLEGLIAPTASSPINGEWP
jgi:hypothetical protein